MRLKLRPEVFVSRLGEHPLEDAGSTPEVANDADAQRKEDFDEQGDEISAPTSSWLQKVEQQP